MASTRIAFRLTVHRLPTRKVSRDRNVNGALPIGLMGNPVWLFQHSKHLMLALVFAVRSATLSIMVPETFLEMYAAQRGSGERRFIVEELVEAQDKNRALLNAMTCISSFLEKYTVQPDRASFWISEDLAGDGELQESFLGSLRTQISLYLVGDLAKRGAHQTAASGIILARDSYSLQNTTGRLVYLCGRDCDYILILTAPFEDEESFLAETDTLLETAWKQHSVGKVVVLGTVGDSVLLSGTTTFRAGEFCVPSPPVVLDRCENNLWPRFKSIELPVPNGCIFNVGYIVLPPYSLFSNTTETLSGIEGFMIEEMAKHSDIVLSREEISWDDDTKLLKNITQWQEDRPRVDLVIGGLLWDPDEDIDYTTMYDETQLVWIVPLSSGVTLRGLITPFTPYVWSAVAGVLILGVIVRIFLIRDITCLDMLGLVLGVALRHPRKTSSRILFLSWALFGFCLTQFYLAALAEQLIQSISPQIDDLSELADSNYLLAGTAEFGDIIKDHMEAGDEVMKKIDKKFVPFDSNEYRTKLADLLAGRNDTYAFMVKLNVSQGRKIFPPNIRMLDETVGTYSIAFATWRGQPYLEIINARIETFIQIGLVQFKSRYYTTNNAMLDTTEGSPDSSSELHIHQFIPAFLLMSIGFGAGFFFFILEIIFYPSKWLE